MNRMILALIAGLLSLGTVHAATVSVSIGTYDTTVYKGSSFVVPVTLTLQDGSGSDTVSVGITPASGMSADSDTQSVTFSTQSGSTSLSFILNADEAGTYENPFTVTATLSGATPATGTASSTITIKERPAMEVNFYQTGTPVKVSDSLYTIPVEMEITTSDTEFYNVTVNLTGFTSSNPSHTPGLSAGSSTYVIDYLPAQSTITFQWELNTTGFSVYGIQGSIITDKGSFNAPFSGSYSLGGTPSGGGGGGGPTSGVIIKMITAGGIGEALFDLVDTGFISRIAIASRETVYNIKVVAEALEKKPYPTMPDPIGAVLSYLKLTKAGIANTQMEEADVNFQVPVSWLVDNDINQETVVLLRDATSKWEPMDTTYLSEDADYAYYEAVTPGFSYFVITGEAGSGYVPPAPPAPEETAPPVVTTTPPVAPEETPALAPKAQVLATPAPAKAPEAGEEGGNLKWVLAVIVLLAVVTGAGYYAWQKGMLEGLQEKIGGFGKKEP